MINPKNHFLGIDFKKTKRYLILAWVLLITMGSIPQENIMLLLKMIRKYASLIKNKNLILSLVFKKQTG